MLEKNLAPLVYNLGFENGEINDGFERVFKFAVDEKKEINFKLLNKMLNSLF